MGGGGDAVYLVPELRQLARSPGCELILDFYLLLKAISSADCV
jgi:hypothetical protein